GRPRACRSMVGSPPRIGAGAVVPPLTYAVLVGLLDRRRPRPWAMFAASFLWGIVAAACAAAPLNDLLFDHLAGATDVVRARPLAATPGAPVVEELLKGLGPLLLLLLRPDLLRTPRDGIVCGAFVGLGFDLAEGFQYLMLAADQGGYGGGAGGAWGRRARA